MNIYIVVIPEVSLGLKPLQFLFTKDISFFNIFVNTTNIVFVYVLISKKSTLFDLRFPTRTHGIFVVSLVLVIHEVMWFLDIIHFDSVTYIFSIATFISSPLPLLSIPWILSRLARRKEFNKFSFIFIQNSVEADS